MPEDRYTFTLTGWKALAALALMLAWSGADVWYHIRPVDDAGRQAMQAWLLRAYRGEIPNELIRKRPDTMFEMITRPLPASTEVKIVSASARGGTASMIVKVEVTVNGGSPPDGQPIRYLYVRRDPGDSWKVIWETDSDHYASALWYVP